MKIMLSIMLLVGVAKANVGVEVDPIAYGLNGYSAHFLYNGSYGVNLDLGVFAMQVPELAEQNKGFQSSFNGYGIKLNYQGKSATGPFAGFNYGTSRFDVEQTTTKATQTVDIHTFGVQFGYCFGNDGFYIKPWIGFDKLLNRPQLDFSGTVYSFPEINVFPTVHLGYRF